TSAALIGASAGAVGLSASLLTMRMTGARRPGRYRLRQGDGGLADGRPPDRLPGGLRAAGADDRRTRGGAAGQSQRDHGGGQGPRSHTRGPLLAGGGPRVWTGCPFT